MKRLAQIVWLAAAAAAPAALAQAPGSRSTAPTLGRPTQPAAARSGTAPAADGAVTLPNLAERNGWPSPVADTMRYGSVLFDNLEYRAGGSAPNFARWDMLGWYGGDVNRLWVRSEGDYAPSSKGERNPDLQVLYGRLIAPFFDATIGLRQQWMRIDGQTRQRTFAVIGLQGLAPYRFEFEPSLFISQNGDVSARVTATYDVLFTQRLVLQPRIEVNAAGRSVERFGVGSGMNDLDLGLRLRYEIVREFAPYIGVTYTRTYGRAAEMRRAEDAPVSQWKLVAGVRIWY